MGKIISINKNWVRIEFSSFCIRLFLKYRGPYCSEIRIWKLPPGGSFLSMFNTKNLVWAMYTDAAKIIQGWFTPPPITQPDDKRLWFHVFAERIADCKNYDEIKKFLIDTERMVAGVSDAMPKSTNRRT